MASSASIVVDMHAVNEACDEFDALFRCGSGLPLPLIAQFQAIVDDPDDSVVFVRIAPGLAAMVVGPLAAALAELRAIRAAEGAARS